MLSHAQHRLLAVLENGVAPTADEQSHYDRIVRFVLGHEIPMDRGIHEGHVTATAVICDPSFERTLLIYHRKLDRWLSPGGHAEAGEVDGLDVALREAVEETGIERRRLRGRSLPVGYDVHVIPARKSEPQHEHFDLRYLVLCEGTDFRPNRGEVERAQWFGLDDVAKLSLVPNLYRVLEKVRGLR